MRVLLLVIGLIVVLGTRPARGIVDLSDTLETWRLVGWWGRSDPGGHGLARFRLTLTVVAGPFRHDPLYGGRVRCKSSQPGDCPGTRGDLRNTTFARRGETGIDGRLYDFTADVTFDTGNTCHFEGTSIQGGGLAVTSLFDCMSGSGVPVSRGGFTVFHQGRPMERSTRQ
jgi:hypothetical protein